MKLRRRFPLYTRPLPFVLGAVFLVLGFWHGLNWVWTTSVFSGSFLFQILIPTQLISFEGAKAIWLGVAMLAALVLLVSFGSPKSAGRPGVWSVRWRFYPLVFALGLLLTIYGAIWLLDMGFAADDTPGGFAIFVTLSYVGFGARFFIGTIGFLTLTLGLLFVLASVSLTTGLRGREQRHVAPSRPVARASTRPAAAPESG